MIYNEHRGENEIKMIFISNYFFFLIIIPATTAAIAATPATTPIIAFVILFSSFPEKFLF